MPDKIIVLSVSDNISEVFASAMRLLAKFLRLVKLSIELDGGIFVAKSSTVAQSVSYQRVFD